MPIAVRFILMQSGGPSGGRRRRGRREVPIIRLVSHERQYCIQMPGTMYKMMGVAGSMTEEVNVKEKDQVMEAADLTKPKAFTDLGTEMVDVMRKERCTLYVPFTMLIIESS